MASKAWKLEEREGRGCCLVANKSLLPGELVLSEEPLFTIRAENHDSDLDQCLENALEGLKAENRLAFFSLADSRASLSNSKKTARGIYFTNCYTLGQTTAVDPIVNSTGAKKGVCRSFELTGALRRGKN